MANTYRVWATLDWVTRDRLAENAAAVGLSESQYIREMLPLMLDQTETDRGMSDADKYQAMRSRARRARYRQAGQDPLPGAGREQGSVPVPSDRPAAPSDRPDDRPAERGRNTRIIPRPELRAPLSNLRTIIVPQPDE